MNQREKILAIGCGLALVGWMFGSTVDATLFGPFRDRSARLRDLDDKTEQLEDQMLALARARKQMTDWKAASLPPDRGANVAKRPDALDAQRLYQAWLTNLTQLAGLDSASVKPAASRRYGNAGRGSTSKPVYVGVVVTIDTEGRFSQLSSFLDHFYSANLLQRINKLNIESRESLGDPVMKLSLEAEGLALVDVPWRATLFPETRLASAITDKAVTCTVSPTTAFPQKTPFRIRIGTEFATVTEVAGTTWKLERGVDRTAAGKHAEGAVVELAPVRPQHSPRDAEQFRELLAANVFVKPQPPREYQLRLAPIAQQTFNRGQSWNYTIAASNYDATLGKPEFVAKSELPEGMELDRDSGRLSWLPTAEQAAGTVRVEVDVRHPSAKTGSETARLSVTLRDANTPPTVTVPGRQLAILGRPWSLPLQVRDAETPGNRITLTLENPPAGLELDTRRQELTWTPPATLVPGDYTVTVVATDDGQPPLSKKLDFPVSVQDDDALFTFLVGSISVDGVWQAWLYNRAQGSRLILKVGDQLQIADISGTVAEIGRDYLILRTTSRDQRLELGHNLRDLTALNITADINRRPR